MRPIHTRLPVLLMTVCLSCGGGSKGSDGSSPAASDTGGGQSGGEGGGKGGASGLDAAGRGGGGGTTGAGGTAGTGSGGTGTGGAGMGTGGNGGKTGAGGSSQGGAGGGGKDAAAGMDAPVADSTCKLKLTVFVPPSANLMPMYLKESLTPEKRTFIVDRRGYIRLMKNGALLDTPFLDFHTSVAPIGNTERGFHSIALHPQYADNGRFFVFYNRAAADPFSTPAPGSEGQNGDVVVAEGKRSAANPDLADKMLTPLFVVPHVINSNHNGGTAVFGPDGLLYVGIGDGGAGGDPFKAAQDVKFKLGKILRIDVDKPTERPAGNVDTPGADPHIWDYGMRNPFRFSFDRLTGDLLIGDVGQDTWEEIDFEPKGQGRRNYGWSVVEGKHCYNAATCDQTGKVLPIYEYQHAGANLDAKARAVIGGYVYRGAAIPCLQGRYLFAEYSQSEIWALTLKADGTVDRADEITQDLVTPQTPISGPVSFSEDGAGELYLFHGMDGTVYRIDHE